MWIRTTLGSFCWFNYFFCLLFTKFCSTSLEVRYALASLYPNPIQDQNGAQCGSNIRICMLHITYAYPHRWKKIIFIPVTFQFSGSQIFTRWWNLRKPILVRVKNMTFKGFSAQNFSCFQYEITKCIILTWYVVLPELVAKTPVPHPTTEKQKSLALCHHGVSLR